MKAVQIFVFFSFSIDFSFLSLFSLFIPTDELQSAKQQVFFSRACTTKILTAVIYFTSLKAQVFVTVNRFLPSLIFAGKAGAYLSRPLTGAKGLKVGYKCWTRVEVTNSDQHPILLRYEVNYSRKKFYSAGPECQFVCKE